MRKNIATTVVVLTLLLTMTSGVTAVSAPPPSTTNTLTSGDIACDVAITRDRILWQPQFDYAAAVLTVNGPGQMRLVQTFKPGDEIVLNITSSHLLDGLHQYALNFSPEVTPEAQTAMNEIRDSAGEQPSRTQQALQDAIPAPLPPLSGSFRVLDGSLLLSNVPEIASNEIEQAALNTTSGIPAPQAMTPLDVYYADDMIVDGSLCVGFDCINGESFGFDTIKLKENNLRLYFQDTSYTAGFPTTDWAIVANDTTNGGASKFAVEQRDASRTPFTLMGDARANAIYVTDDNIGLGTSVPNHSVVLELARGDSPKIRFNQDGTWGWPKYDWELGANEANFFLSNITTGNFGVFRIGPLAPGNSLTIRSADGRVGVGTWDPKAQLHISDSSSTAAPSLRIENTNVGTSTRTLMHLSNLGTSEVVVENRASGSTWTAAYTDTYTMVYSDGSLSDPVQALELDKAGNMVIRGALVESSDVALKENFTPIDRADILAALADLDIQTWNYIADDDAVEHMGPIAQDFHAAFGLGFDDKHISPLDANGVTMAAVQALVDRVSAQEEDIDAQTARIAELEQENADLAQRLASLESLVNQLVAED